MEGERNKCSGKLSQSTVSVCLRKKRQLAKKKKQQQQVVEEGKGKKETHAPVECKIRVKKKKSTHRVLS